MKDKKNIFSRHLSVIEQIFIDALIPDGGSIKDLDNGRHEISKKKNIKHSAARKAMQKALKKLKLCD